MVYIMPTLYLNNPASIGLISDLRYESLGLEGFSRVGNVRFTRDGISRTLGEQSIWTTPGTTPFSLMQWNDSTAAISWFYLSGTAAIKTDGTTHTDVSPTAGAFSGGTWPVWTGGVIGGVAVVNNDGGIDYPHYFDPVTGVFEPLPAWTATHTTGVMRVFKEFLVALDITEGATRYPTKLRWSHPADPGGLPVSWDVTDPTVDAGEVALDDTPGFLVDCLPLGDLNMVYKEDSVWSMRYVGGQSIFSFRKVFDFGAISPNAVVEVERKHFVVTIGDVKLHDGQQQRSIIEGRVRDYLFGRLSSNNYKHLQVVKNELASEVWICYPVQDGAAKLEEVLIWNWLNGTWTVRELDALALAAGVIPTGEDLTFDGEVGDFDTSAGGFDDRSYSPLTQKVLVGRASGFSLLDSGYDFAGVQFTAFAERTGLGFIGQDQAGKVRVDTQRVKFLRALWPSLEIASGSYVNFYLATQERIDGPTTWAGPFPFYPATQQKVDCTLSGKVLGWRIEDGDAKAWKLTRLGFEFELGGKF